MTGISGDEKNEIGDRAEKALATTIETLFPEAEIRGNVGYSAGDLDIFVEDENQSTFFEVKNSANYLGKAMHQVVKGEKHLERKGFDPTGKAVIYDKDFGSLLNSLDKLGPFFSRSQLTAAYREEGDELIQSFHIPIVAPLQWVMNDWEEEGEYIGDNKHFNQFDYELLENFNLIEKIGDTYRPTSHMHEVLDRKPEKEQILHKTPRYDLFTSPYSDSFEEDIAEALSETAH